LTATNLSGDVTASFQATDSLMLYGTYAKAFKSGGVNLGGLPTDASGAPILAAATVKPEKVNHFEIGAKTQWWGGRATLNLAAFRTNIHDYQAQVVNGAIGVLRGYLSNAEKVRVQGFEAEATVRPSHNVNLYGNVTRLDGKYISFPDAPCPVDLTGGPAFCDISGQRLPGISKWAASWGGEIDKAVGTGTAYVGTDWSYRSSFSSSPSPSQYMWVKGYTLASFRLGYRTSSRWDGFVWVKNAFNARYFNFLSAQPGNTGLIVGEPGDPRTYGITLTKRF
jgi:iron complex outermembrane receptor protein